MNTYIKFLLFFTIFLLFLNLFILKNITGLYQDIKGIRGQLNSIQLQTAVKPSLPGYIQKNIRLKEKNKKLRRNP